MNSKLMIFGISMIVAAIGISVVILQDSGDTKENIRKEINEKEISYTFSDDYIKKTTEGSIVENPIILSQKIREIVDDIEIKYEQTEFGKTLIVSIPPRFSGQFFSDSDWVGIANQKIGKIMRIVYTNSDYDYIKMVVVVINENFVDSYGSTNEEVGYAVSLSRDTASKIKDWNIFIYGNPTKLPYHSIADNSKGDRAYLHPSFSIN